MARARYTQDQVEFLREHWPAMTLDELTEAFNYVFCQERTETAIKTALTNRKIKCGRKPGNPVGSYRLFTEEQADFIREGYKSMSLSELTEAFNERFEGAKSVKQIRSFTRNHKIKSGRTGRFEKGQKAWNGGLAGKGICKPNSGTFKKGNVPGNIREMGSERICSKDGFVLVKVEEENPYTGAKTRFKHKHVVIWEEANGPVPEGHVIRFLDGDKTNITLENLGLFSRAESLQMSRLGFSDVPKEFKPTITAMAKLDAKRFELGRNSSVISKSSNY